MRKIIIEILEDHNLSTVEKAILIYIAASQPYGLCFSIHSVIGIAELDQIRTALADLLKSEILKTVGRDVKLDFTYLIDWKKYLDLKKNYSINKVDSIKQKVSDTKKTKTKRKVKQ